MSLRYQRSAPPTIGRARATRRRGNTNTIASTATSTTPLLSKSYVLSSELGTGASRSKWAPQSLAKLPDQQSLRLCSTSSPACLLALPTELHLLIDSYLPYPDALALRLTCRGLLSTLEPATTHDRLEWLVSRLIMRLPLPGRGSVSVGLDFSSDVAFVAHPEVQVMLRRRRRHDECVEEHKAREWALRASGKESKERGEDWVRKCKCFVTDGLCERVVKRETMKMKWKASLVGKGAGWVGAMGTRVYRVARSGLWTLREQCVRWGLHLTAILKYIFIVSLIWVCMRWIDVGAADVWRWTVGIGESIWQWVAGVGVRNWEWGQDELSRWA